jgi:phenylpropionate dioxygenase-like ring-hydroxylating dioxygenase large terminal subunit
MEHSTQVRLIREIHALLDAGTTDMVEGQGRVDVDRYIDAERADREREVLFRKWPHLVAHVSQLRRPGDFVATDVAGIPILITRTDEGLRAFLNVCRHRGTRLVDPGTCGHGRKRFVCPYHAWTYGNDGALLGLPHAEGFPDLDRERRGLVEVPVAERAGLVFVRPQPGGAPLDLGEFLGTPGAELESFGLADHHVYESRTLHRPVNWKLVFDLFLEAYHLRYAHRRSIFPMFFDNLGAYERFGPHMRNLFPKRSIAELRDLDEADWDLRAHSNVLYILFPSTILLMQPDHVSVLRVYPEGTDSSRLETFTLVPTKPETEQERRYWDKNIAILYAAIDEDFAMGATAQAGFRSGANQELLLGRFEQALVWFHQEVDSAIAI